MWLIWRPVLAGECSYREMFVDQVFSFNDIHAMHEYLDLKLYDSAFGAWDSDRRMKEARKK